MEEKTINDLFECIKSLDTIEIAQLKNMIDIEVTCLNRSKEIKSQLSKNQTIEFFCPTHNKFMLGKVLDLKQKYAIVFYNNDVYEIPLFSIKTKRSQVNDYKKLSKHSISVDQIVGFKDKEDKIIAAKVIRINDKSVTLIDQIGMKWRVSYSLLFDITDNSKKRVINHE